MIEKIKTLILIGQYKKAKDLIDFSKCSVVIEDFIMGLVLENYSLILYAMIVYLLSINPSSSLHSFAAKLLALPLCHIEGAYSLALYHASKALEMEPDI